jgi:predicted secreted protein
MPALTKALHVARTIGVVAIVTIVACVAAATACRHDEAPAGAPSPALSSDAAPAGSDVVVAGSDVVVHLEDDGKTIDVPRGATLVVKLSLSSGTGYAWTPAASDAGVLDAVGERTSEALADAASPMPGGPHLDVLRFAGRTPGTTTLTLELRRAWEHDAPPARSFHVVVHVR